MDEQEHREQVKQKEGYVRGNRPGFIEMVWRFFFKK